MSARDELTAVVLDALGWDWDNLGGDDPGPSVPTPGEAVAPVIDAVLAWLATKADDEESFVGRVWAISAMGQELGVPDVAHVLRAFVAALSEEES